MKIEVNRLSFQYPSGVQALREVSLSIHPGEKVAIVGQNGAGKTTLVKHFNGLLKPSSGTVLVGDWDTRDHSVAKLSRRVGYVFQNPDDQLFSRSVEVEISVGPKNLGYEQDRIDRLVTDAINLTQLELHRDANPYDLSPTWRKMVALASVIAMDTPVVIFDEPTTGQDAINIERIANIVNILSGRGKSLVTITHDIDFAADHYDRLVVMGQGVILLDGPLLEMIAEEEVLASTYVDPPQLTRLGKRLGLPQTVRSQADFMQVYLAWRE